MLNPSPGGKLIIIDDDSNITELLRFNLNSEGFSIDIAPIAADVNKSTLQEYRLVLIDAMQQDYDGFDFCRDIKSNPLTSSIPVMICTECESEDMIIEAFDQGADEFVAKPFSLRELIARIKAILRRHPMKNLSEIKAASKEINIPEVNLQINTDTQRVTAMGEPVQLTKTEYSILLFLVRHANSFFTRDDIYQEVWKDNESSNIRIIDTNISRLRKKLGESGKAIINRYGMGYAFTTKPKE